MKLESVYYTPQQVASFYSIRKDTLLYYDKIGLFSPSKRRDNGYRCYDASKLSELETILTLRDLGFSIPAIKDAIDSLNAASFMSLLEKEEGSIRRKIDSYLSLLSVIDAIRRATADATKAESRKLYTAAFPSQPIMTEPIRNKKGEATDDEVWAEAYGKLLARADGKAIIMTGSIVDLGNAESGHDAADNLERVDDVLGEVLGQLAVFVEDLADAAVLPLVRQLAEDQQPHDLLKGKAPLGAAAVLRHPDRFPLHPASEYAPHLPGYPVLPG